MNYAKITVKSPFFAAPMAGITDGAFRTVCAEYGAALTYTEMVSARALCHDDKKTEGLLKISGLHRPCFAQIFGSGADIMAEGAKKALDISKADGIDINMGCPMPKIVRNGDGSALMKSPSEVEKIVSAVKNAVSVPVTVKIRAGWDKSSINAEEIAKAAEAGGADAIAVHGRTASQQYEGVSDPFVIESVKKSVSVPVCASGDIFSAQDAVNIMQKTGADCVMIARGARGNPFIFAQCEALLKGKEIKEPDIREILNTLLHQAEIACEEKGEARAMPELRKHALWYLGKIRGAKQFKIKAALVSTLSELKNICEEAANKIGGIEL